MLLFLKRLVLMFLIAAVFIVGCTKLEDLEKYQQPDWLTGKIYSQIKADSSLSIFTSLLERTGYDTVLDRTGSFTVFTPTDHSFINWLNARPEYAGDIANISSSEAEAIVQYHIIQNRWSREQFMSLDINGWIDKDDPGNNKPKGYKRQTLYKNPNRKYYYKEIDQDLFRIVDSTESDNYRLVYTESRKYLPIFFQEYFDLYDLESSDYEFYFNRTFDASSIYVANAKIITNEIPTENGFIYKVDQVIDQPYNAEEYLLRDHGERSTRKFLDLIYEMPSFSQNLGATLDQPEALAGGLFDTLYTLRYPFLTFDIHEELTGPNRNNPRNSVRYHNGILIPTDQALQKLINQVITVNSGYPRWSSWEAVPQEVRKIIVNTHMTETPVYRTNLQEGFINGTGDKTYMDESIILESYYGSNASMLLLDEALVSRAFTSITGPAYLRPGYSTMMYALEYSNTLPALKKAGREYVFFIPSDMTLQQDSSLLLNWINRNRNQYNFRALDRSFGSLRNTSSNVLAKRIFNQVAIKPPRGIARREFIENLAGNYLVFDNEINTVSGGLNNTWGYLGDSAIDLEPVLFEEPIDNGISYKFEGWFRTPTDEIYIAISKHQAFMNLIDKAGLNNPQLYSFNFLNEGEFYTVFIPDENALSNSGADTLSLPDLQQFIKSHFIKGVRIWTDGSVPGGSYETLRKIESSNNVVNAYTPMQIETGYDYINILDQDGQLFHRIDEDPEKTNKMIATRTVAINPQTHDYTITGVIHVIDTVLHKAIAK